jgi:hypothetical protein
MCRVVDDDAFVAIGAVDEGAVSEGWSFGDGVLSGGEVGGGCCCDEGRCEEQRGVQEEAGDECHGC